MSNERERGVLDASEKRIHAIVRDDNLSTKVIIRITSRKTAAVVYSQCVADRYPLPLAAKARTNSGSSATVVIDRIESSVHGFHERLQAHDKNSAGSHIYPATRSAMAWFDQVHPHSGGGWQ